MIQLQSTHRHDGTLQDLAPDLTPMLDILFILLVFFMLTAGAVFQSLDLTLPSNVAEKLPVMDEPKHIMVEIRKNGYAVDGKAIANFAALQQQLPAIIAARPEHELIIASDKTIPIERLLHVLTYLQAQGIAAANILMQSESP
jgi:biopolymer transport protein ExbD